MAPLSAGVRAAPRSRAPPGELAESCSGLAEGAGRRRWAPGSGGRLFPGVRTGRPAPSFSKDGFQGQPYTLTSQQNVLPLPSWG